MPEDPLSPVDPPLSVDSSPPAPPPDDGQSAVIDTDFMYILFVVQVTVNLSCPDNGESLKSNSRFLSDVPPVLVTESVFS